MGHSNNRITYSWQQYWALGIRMGTMREGVFWAIGGPFLIGLVMGEIIKRAWPGRAGQTGLC